MAQSFSPWSAGSKAETAWEKDVVEEKLITSWRIGSNERGGGRRDVYASGSGPL